MSKLCIIEGCPNNIRNKRRGEKIYYYKALEDQVEQWSRVIPGDKKVKLNDKICSRHFKDEDLIKEWNFVINDETVTMPRGRWQLRIGAIPAIFDNYKDDLRAEKYRKSKPTSFLPSELQGSSSSDEEIKREKPRRKRRKKSEQINSTVVKKSAKRVPEKAASQSPTWKTLEHCGKSDDQGTDATWEKACDNFVDQLNSLCSTSANKSDAKTAKRGPGRPRKHPIRGAKPPADKLHAPRRGPARPTKCRPTSPSPSTSSKREKSAGGASDAETENSVIIEHFVASGCEADTHETHSPSGSDAKPAKRRVGRPPKKRRRAFVSKMKREKSVRSNSKDVVIIETDSDSFSPISNEFAIPPQVTVKSEECDVRYENGDSVSNIHADRCSLTSTEDSALRHQGDELNCEAVEVKREICDCEGENSLCCENVQNSDQTILELPASPIHCEETDQPLNLQIDSNSLRSERQIGEQANEISIEEVCIIHAVQNSTADIASEPIPTPDSDSRKQETQVTPGRANLSKFKMYSTDQAIQNDESLNRRLTPEIGYDLTSRTKSPTTNINGKLPQTAKAVQRFKDNFDPDMDFLGFSSGEEEGLVLKRNALKDSAGMALKSTKLYFSRLNKAINSSTNKLPADKEDSSPRNRRVAARERKSSMEIAMDQLHNLNTMEPACSAKPVTHENQPVVKDSASKIPEHVNNGKFTNKNDPMKDKVANNLKCDEVLKCGRISNEVTVTKASNSSRGLDKVRSTSNFSPTLDKVTTTSKFNLQLPQASKPIPNTDKVRSSSSSLKEKVPYSSNHELFKTVGTSTSENVPLRDKIPTTYGPVNDRLSHLMNVSSLDRIVQSSKGTSLLDSVTSGSIRDPTVDKTSLILKNFKSDGVLALECVVLKEQVRQLQKELFLHKQMLIDSEHNASLLQRRLELQAQLPCVNCVNIKRGFIGKETLI